MKLYRTEKGIVIEEDENFYLIENNSWDDLINDEDLPGKLQQLVSTAPTGGRELISNLLAPVGHQEIWACGVTFLRSKIGRQRVRMPAVVITTQKCMKQKDPRCFSRPLRILWSGQMEKFGFINTVA